MPRKPPAFLQKAAMLTRVGLGPLLRIEISKQKCSESMGGEFASCRGKLASMEKPPNTLVGRSEVSHTSTNSPHVRGVPLLLSLADTSANVNVMNADV